MDHCDGEVIMICRFPLLFKLAAALLCIHHSAAEVERRFSVEKEVLTLKRNRMDQSTFNAHMLIHNNVKSLGGCRHVKAAITAEMRKAYAAAHSARKEYLKTQQEKATKEAQDRDYIHKRKRKINANLHQHKMRELTKKLADTTTAKKRPPASVSASASAAKTQKQH